MLDVQSVVVLPLTAPPGSQRCQVFFLVQSVAVLIKLSTGKARGFDRVLFFLFTFPLIRCFFLLSFNGMFFFIL